MIDEKDYKRYQHIALVVSNYDSYYVDEILAVFLEVVLRKNVDIPNDGYVRVALKNTLKNILKKERLVRNYRDNSLDDIYRNGQWDSDVFKEDIEGSDTIKDFDDITIDDYDLKKRCMSEIFLRLDDPHQMLYILHFVRGISQRKISRDTGVTMRKVNTKINKIKEMIREEFIKINNKNGR